MAEIQGYCMKCKTYGPIKNGEKIAMANGRTRMAGFCSQAWVHGEDFQDHCVMNITAAYRIHLIEMSGGLTYLGLVV